MKTQAQQFISAQSFSSSLTEKDAHAMLRVFSVMHESPGTLDSPVDIWTLADGSRVRHDDYGFHSLCPASEMPQ